MEKISGFSKWILGSRVRLAIIIIIFLAGFLSYKHFSTSSQQPQYQTAQVEKGTLIQSVSASGNITSANNVLVTIQSSGVVKEVLVKNGDQVSVGQTLATLTLDQASQQKAASAYASFLSTQNSLAVAQAKFNSLQSAEFTANQKFINDAVARGLTTTDPIYIEENANWLQAEADYKNQQGAVMAAQAALSSAGLTLSQVSSTITAPAAGVVKGLTITPGAIVTVTSSSSNSTSTSQVLGSIYQAGSTQALVNLSEIDSINVSEGQKATLTLDAFPNKTFTGKLASINTNGVAASGVTSYPAVIIFDTSDDHIYPNMAVSAKIITKIADNVLLVPTTAIQTSNGQSTVRVIKNNQPNFVNIEVGDSNDTQTEVTSGINEGETVITGTSVAGTGSTNTSPFGAIRGFGGFGGGGGRGGGRGGGG